MPMSTCIYSTCSRPGTPTAGLLGGPIWLRMSTRPDSSSSRCGAAIAATPGGLQQLLQHTTSLPMSDLGGCWVQGYVLHLLPMHGHARSDQLAAKLLAAPAGLPVPRPGGACREGTAVKTHFQAPWPHILLYQRPHLSDVSQRNFSCKGHGSLCRTQTSMWRGLPARFCRPFTSSSTCPASPCYFQPAERQGADGMLSLLNL